MLGLHAYATTGTTNKADLSATSARCALPPRKFLGTHFCQRLSGPQGYLMRTERGVHLKTSKDRTGNKTRNLSPCGIVSQPTAAQLAPLPTDY